MKMCLNSMLFIFLACGFSSAEEMPVFDAMITVHVIDDLGQPVSNVTIAVSTFKKWHPGEGFGRNENEVITGISDTNGMVTLEIPCISGKVAYGARDAEGYYKTYSENFAYSHSDDDKWYPWNPTVEIMLKRIVNPIPMYAKRFKTQYGESFPLFGVPVGFDLEKGDWVEPYGDGITADVIFTLKKKNEQTVTYGRYGREAKLTDTTLSIRFSNDYDGLQSVYAQSHKGSKLKLDREAPEKGYVSNLTKRICRSDPEKPIQYWHFEGDNERLSDSNNKHQDQNYFFRVRTKKDEGGNVNRALYGKIHGDFDFDWEGYIGFTYYLNPTPNDRNLEFDPSHNLFTDLKSWEQVEDP